MHNKVFFENIGAVLLYAVVGTALNFILIGGFLVLLQYVKHSVWAGEEFPSDPTTSQIFLFASLISAVGGAFYEVMIYEKFKSLF